MKVNVTYDAEIGMPRVELVPENCSEEQALELLAAFDDVRFSYEINE